jgi:hypothetical protein
MLKLRNTACVIICGLLPVGCTTTEKPESNSHVRDTVQSQPPEAAEGETKTTQKTFSDSLIVEQPIYADTAKILLAGQFHEDEVWPGAGGEEWYGLFRGSNGHYLMKSRLQTTRVPDELLDMEDEASGWLLSTENSDESLLFISGLGFLNEKPLESLDSARGEIFPGDTLRYSYGSADYMLYSTATENPNVEERAYSPVLDYKLYLTAQRNGTLTRQLLLEIEHFDGEMIDVIFAGDIDGDDVPDLIINTSRHYNVSSPTLYLSRPVTMGFILKAVGQHRSVGC